MFEKEGIKYAIEETVGTECLSMPIEDFHFIDLADEQQEKAQCYKDGATFGYNKAKEEMIQNGLALQSDMDKTIEQNIALKKKLNKANEWHYPSKGELPNVNQECYFIHSNTYGQQGNKPIFTKSSIQVHAGVYTNAYDEEGNETTDFCFYDDFIEEEMDINEVYAWKEIELPKEIKEK